MGQIGNPVRTVEEPLPEILPDFREPMIPFETPMVPIRQPEGVPVR